MNAFIEEREKTEGLGLGRLGNFRSYTPFIISLPILPSLLASLDSSSSSLFLIHAAISDKNLPIARAHAPFFSDSPTTRDTSATTGGTAFLSTNSTRTLTSPSLTLTQSSAETPETQTLTLLLLGGAARTSAFGPILRRYLCRWHCTPLVEEKRLLS